MARKSKNYDFFKRLSGMSGTSGGSEYLNFGNAIMSGDRYRPLGLGRGWFGQDPTGPQFDPSNQFKYPGILEEDMMGRAGFKRDEQGKYVHDDSLGVWGEEALASVEAEKSRALDQSSRRRRADSARLSSKLNTRPGSSQGTKLRGAQGAVASSIWDREKIGSKAIDARASVYDQVGERRFSGLSKMYDQRMKAWGHGQAAEDQARLEMMREADVDRVWWNPDTWMG